MQRGRLNHEVISKKFIHGVGATTSDCPNQSVTKALRRRQHVDVRCKYRLNLGNSDLHGRYAREAKNDSCRSSDTFISKSLS
jgi:hypothetical protein